MKRRIFAVLMLIGVCAAPAATDAKTVPSSRTQIDLSFAPLVRKAAPAVVNIYAKRLVRRRARQTLFDDPIFNRLFGDSPFGGYTRERLENSLGSGVLVDPAGLIVTNNHVIENAQEITVVMADRREYAAEIVVTDKRTDIAVLRVDPAGEALPFLQLDDSDELEVGDLVLAIGNPFGVGQTVTSGIVSALARTSVGVSDFQFFIQTDAAINPGNSGGALLAMNGRLIGVNTAIFSRNGGGSLGIGFAVPSSMVRTVVDSAKRGRAITRPWLSFTGKAVNAEIAGALGLRRPVGVLVEKVHPTGPAAAAGLRPGDVVIAVGRHEIDDGEALRFRVATRSIGDQVKLKVIRRNNIIDLPFNLVAPIEDPPRDLTEIDGPNPFSGLRVGNLSPALAEEIGMKDSLAGVVVLQVQGNSTAARLGFKPKDIVREVNGETIESVQDLIRAGSREAGRWRLVIRRKDRNLRLEVRG